MPVAPSPCPRRPRSPQRGASAGTSRAAVVALGLVLGAGACERSELADGLPATMDCTSCHGRPGDPSPPAAVDGSTSTTALGVGAHSSHRTPSIARAVSCAECHVIPTDLSRHPDPLARPAEVVFGPTATAAGATPSWDRASATCTGGYCHGATLFGAETRPGPRWTRVAGPQKTCTSCHGNPPGGAHTTSTACEGCHTAVAGPGGTIIDPSRHVDGKVDVGQTSRYHPADYASPTVHGPDTYRSRPDCRPCHGAALEGTASVVGCDACHPAGWRTDCVFCHGGALEPSGAPPLDLLGGTATTSLGVGAHTEHVSRTTHAAFACTECHAPVVDVTTPEHLFDATPGRAEVVFVNGRSPAGQYAEGACSAVYCHGTGLTAGSVASFVPASPLDCQSCHPTGTQSAGHGRHAAYPCSTCHLDVVADDQTVLAPDLHVDGVVEVRMSTGTYLADTRTCAGSACHPAGDVAW